MANNKKRQADTAQSCTKRFKPNYHDTIIVLVGKEEKSFTVHEAMICHKSPFFAAACQKQWKEGRERTVKLPEIKPHVFGVYVHWVYTNEIDLSSLNKHSFDGYFHPAMTEVEKTRAAQTFASVHLYAATDRFLDVAAKIAVVDEIMKRKEADSDLGLTVLTMKDAWSQLPADCGLQRFLLDVCLCCTLDARVRMRRLRDRKDRLPKDFWVDLAARQVDFKLDGFLSKSVSQWDKCRYHDHQDGVTCRSTT